MQVTRKFINGIQFNLLELYEYDNPDYCKDKISVPFTYVIDPPIKFETLLIKIGYTEEIEMFLLGSTKIDTYTIPKGFSLSEAKYVDIQNLIDIGEENYPVWLKHNRIFFENAILSEDITLLKTLNNEGKIIGKIVGEKENNICKIRAIGLQPEYRNLGIGKALVSYLSYLMKSNIYTVISLPNNIQFWENIGFKFVKNIKHYTNIDKKVL